ncbi:MAG: adenosylcobinamide-GDP ribazoletransferase [Lachnospiraceae bacterium]|nr:adenosylcobinamide-GDP ribazoletransferase [Lachnospiraceae bacterium]
MKHSFFAAFLMYSRIPMPEISWEEENHRYALCFFPLIGMVIGGLEVLWWWLGRRFGIGTILYGAGAAALPLWVTGGIHMDGYMDVWDAKACLGSQEKMFQVMKDSRIGAFAAIHVCLYLLLQTALFTEISSIQAVMVAAGCFIQSRAFSALAAVTWNNARKEGTLQSFTRPAQKYLTISVELIWLVAVWCGMCLVHLPSGIGAVAGGLAAFLYYRWFSTKTFGGITGDLAGYFLQICELAGLAGVVAGSWLMK